MVKPRLGRGENENDLLSAADALFRRDYEQDDLLAPFNFAARYVELQGKPGDIPEWVAEHFVRIAGEYALAVERDRRAGKAPKKSLGEFAGLTRKKLWKSRRDRSHAALFLTLFNEHTRRARKAIEATGSAYTKRFRRDGTPLPIPENEHTDGQEICAIINKKNETTKKFQVMLARQCGITGASDVNIYRNVRRLLKKQADQRFQGDK